MRVYVEPVDHFECPVCNGRIDGIGLTPLSEISCPSCRSTVTVPGMFAHYQLLSRLGEGSTGQIYRARDTKLNRVVAIKILHKVLALNPELVESFRLQARSAANLNHANLIRVYELGRHADQPYITMEVIEGRNLRDLLVHDTGNEEDVLRIGLGIGQGLQAAQDLGHAHGDVKPKNIFLCSDGIPKIGDFGLARGLSAGTGAVIVRASPYYTAPECAAGAPPSAQGDMYGLGATLFQALVGRPPFDDPDPAKVQQLKATQDPPDVRESRPDIRPATADILRRLLQRDPAARFASHADMVKAFQEALDGLHAAQAEAEAAAAAAAAPAEPAKSGAATASRPRSGVRLVLLLSLLGAAAALAWYVWRGMKG